jgi:NADH:ubiquinone oxidoreductase subunit F (NADH-binding)/(2Fe-2S) ferredoxin/NAD-dependent dihydropyrimidine dehydrogenase PreA subunit
MSTKIGSPRELETLRNDTLSNKRPYRLTVSVCSSTGCVALGSRMILKTLMDKLEAEGLDKDIEVKETGCLGFCEKGPRVTVYPGGISYFQVKPDDVGEIVDSALKGAKPIEKLLLKDEKGKPAKRLEEIPFYRLQHRLLLSDNEKIDPRKIWDYVSIGGYSALSKVLSEWTPEQVLEEVKKSGLRGRGGGGFPTWRKWESTRDAPGSPKYVIVNCDEGDPGAFMDRSMMEGNPHKILEGLMIGAYAMGASKGYIYIREEYPIAFSNVKAAIEQARELGLIGEKILGSDFNFDIKVHSGAGAFVSGESSALVEAIEGRVGEPRPKYVHIAEKGIKGKPTCLNNVKTWASVPMIVLNGGEWFRKVGTERSSGTNIFSLVGNVNNTGLVEVPMGITLRDIVYKIGGGVRGGKKFKAVQTGGPSGGFIPESKLDLEVDFDALTEAGSMMGSGSMVVMNDDTCMVDAARYFVDFLLEESCGKCIPCREGLRVLSATLGRICDGRGEPYDLDTVREVTELMKTASLCSLGKTAANPVLTSMRYFPDEWTAHVEDKVCPARKCKALIRYEVDPEKCKSCGLCAKGCPVGAATWEKKQPAMIDADKCIKCGECFDDCKFGAVVKLSGLPVQAANVGGRR